MDYSSLFQGAMQGAQGIPGVVGGALQGAGQQMPGMQQTISGALTGTQQSTAPSMTQDQLGRWDQWAQQMIANGQGSLIGTPPPGSQLASGSGSFTIAGNGLGWGEQPSGTSGGIWDEFHGMNNASGSGGNPAATAAASEGENRSGSGGLLGGSGSPISNTATPGGITGFPNISAGNLNSGGVGQFGPGVPPGSPAQMGAGSVPMMQMGAGNALQNYYNTPGYQLTNGQGAVNQFQTSPGYQFAVDQALKQVQQQGASRGLLDSGAGLRAMTDRAQGMANQEFNNWQTNQQNQYNQYQNRLQGLASGPTGADMAYGLGNTVGQNNMATGSNIGSILANQGNSLFGGIVGAGGAQAQNVTQAGNMQAQILGSNLQTQMMLAALAAGQQGARQ